MLPRWVLALCFNGETGRPYGFMLTAIDGEANCDGGQDKFRMRIWDRDGDRVIYDSQLDAPNTSDPTTVNHRVQNAVSTRPYSHIVFNQGPSMAMDWLCPLRSRMILPVMAF
ncbi:MAG TPA: hypothetical protein PKY77_27170, partial [Phycisphaerae bacterium]|nr:hypothetical protein [Phycisphaerae bacterium]